VVLGGSLTLTASLGIDEKLLRAAWRANDAKANVPLDLARLYAVIGSNAGYGILGSAVLADLAKEW
jgi:hypothetical protein